ncbi:MAG: hypothetical protein PHO61_01760, partial [Candidatus ainarchaeum sp.]|nr:hypothetical protein [Candidatus ainarchaeum sp.]
MNNRFILLLVALFCFFSIVFSAGENFNKENVIVEYHGAWQWGAVQYHSYTLSELGSASFGLDLDDADEGWIGVNYQVGPANSSWKMEFLPSLSGSRSVVVKITRDGSICFNETINALPLTGDKYLPANKCGINFSMDWEWFGETDVMLGNFSINADVKKKILEKAISLDVGGKINALKGKINSINSSKFRVIDIRTDDFYNAGDKYFFYSTPFGLNEEAQGGQKNSMIISDNGKIKYLIFLPNETGINDFKVLKPSKEIDILSIKSFDELSSRADKGEFTVVNKRKITTAQDFANLFGVSTIAGGSTAAAVTGVAFIGTYTAATAATATTAATGATFALGGATVGTGGMILIPVAVAALIGLPTWYLTDTDTYTFDNQLTINYDAEFFSGNEWKINHLMYSADTFTENKLPEVSGTVFTATVLEDDVLELPLSGTTLGWVGYFKEYTGKSDLTDKDIISSLEFYSVSDGKETKKIFNSAVINGNNIQLSFNQNSLSVGDYVLVVNLKNKDRDVVKDFK